MRPLDAKAEVSLEQGDCLEVMGRIPDGSVDMVLCDLPYGVINGTSEAGKWDCQIPLEPLWREWLRVAKDNAAVVLFSQGMFTAQLMASRPKLWRYNLVWDKCRASGFLNSKKMPLRRHEDICVFYRRQPTYNQQLVRCDDPKKQTHSRGRLLGRKTNRVYGDHKDVPTRDPHHKYPGSILSFPRPHATGNHPTEKSVDLCRWLIRTYTNPGELVLDATAGSGTTGVAAVLEGRRCICIERERKYYDTMKRRIAKAAQMPRQEALPCLNR